MPGVSFSPLSEYLYLLGHHRAIDDVMVETIAALNDQSFNDGIEVGTEKIKLTPNITTIRLSDGRQQALPTLDLKDILEEYKIFLDTPPLDEAIVK